MVMGPSLLQRLAVGGWWRLAAVGGWRLVVGEGWRRLVVGGWWRLAAVGGWRLAVGGGWRRLVVGGWRLVAVGGWWLAVGDWWSLGAVLKRKKKKIWVLKDSPAEWGGASPYSAPLWECSSGRPSCELGTGGKRVKDFPFRFLFCNFRSPRSIRSRMDHTYV